MHPIHYPILKDLGLSDTEALIYELLLEAGPTKARDIFKKSGIGRGNVYNVLVQLESKALITKTEGKQTVYAAVDPSQLEKLLDARLDQAKQLEVSFRQALTEMNSTFNLSTGRPAIQIFEGLDGAKKALYDSLNAKGEILTYFDITELKKGSMEEINKQYIRKRIAQKIEKRLIVADTPESRAFFKEQNTPYTKVAFVKGYLARHATSMQLYDDTVSYVTLTDGKRISMLIKDTHIYEMHRQQFEFLWSQTEEIVDYAARRTSS